MDINASHIMNKHQYWIELNHVKLFNKNYHFIFYFITIFFFELYFKNWLSMWELEDNAYWVQSVLGKKFNLLLFKEFDGNVYGRFSKAFKTCIHLFRLLTLVLLRNIILVTHFFSHGCKIQINTKGRPNLKSMMRFD